jgi:hypothetical protein
MAASTRTGTHARPSGFGRHVAGQLDESRRGRSRRPVDLRHRRALHAIRPARLVSRAAGAGASRAECVGTSAAPATSPARAAPTTPGRYPECVRATSVRAGPRVQRCEQPCVGHLGCAGSRASFGHLGRRSRRHVSPTSPLGRRQHSSATCAVSRRVQTITSCPASVRPRRQGGDVHVLTTGGRHRRQRPADSRDPSRAPILISATYNRVSACVRGLFRQALHGRTTILGVDRGSHGWPGTLQVTPGCCDTAS